MKNVRFFAATLLTMAMLFLLTACPGPQGEKGDIGPQGVQGEAGPTGPQGPAGTANVIYSAWITATNWVSEGYFGRAGQHFDISVPKLTQEILDKGMVLTYWKPAGNPLAIIPIPANTGSSINVEFYPEYKVERIRIFAFGGVFSNSTNNQFRYIIIPGAALANGRKASVDYASYQEVKTAFNLPD